MKKFLKIFVFFILLTVILVAGLSLFIRAYLTEERIKAMIVPQAQQALGRKVDIGSIKVSLFEGIIVKDLVVKEPDGKSDFIKAGEFVLRYDLLPLLHKKLIVSQVKLVKPYVEITRDRAGHYNYESLAIFQANQPNRTRHLPKANKGAKVAAAPLALTVNSVLIKNGHVTFKDELKELPQVDTRINCSLSLETGPDFKSLIYFGHTDFKAQIRYGKAGSQVNGSIKFDNTKAAFEIMTALEGQKIRFEGEVSNYLTLPDARLDISSKQLDVEKLLALAAALPSHRPRNEGLKKTRPAHPSHKWPKGPSLKLKGSVHVGKLLYKPYALEELSLGYRIEHGRLILQDIVTVLNGDGLKGRLGAHADILVSDIAGALWIDTLDINTDRAKAQMGGKISFDRKKIGLRLNLEVDGQKAVISGLIKHYSTSPDVKLDLKSNELDSNKLLALAKAVGTQSNNQKSSKNGKASTKDGTKGNKAPNLPPGLRAHGTVQIGRLLYEDLVIEDMLLKYRLEKGVFYVDKFSARTVDGSITSQAQAAITRRPIPFKGDIKIDGLNISKLLQGIKSPMKGKLSAIFTGKFDFSGSGSDWNSIQKSLNVEGDYQLRDGEIKGIRAITVVSDLLGLPSLRNIDFKNLTGTVHVVEGVAKVKAALSGRNLSVRAKGIIGLDGRLDLPFTLILSKKLTKKLEGKKAFAKYLVNESGNAELNMKLTGTIDRPRPFLDTSMVQKRVKKELTKRVEKELGKLLGTTDKDKGQKEGTQKKITPEGLIKGLLGN